MKQLKISKDISLPRDIVTQTIAILAKRRAGKSYTMRKICEELLENNEQLVMIDPKGDQWGIRSSADGKSPGYPIVILGGEHGDAPLEVNAGAVVAKLVVEERVSVLLDLSSFRKHEIATFMAAFLEDLYRLKAKEEYRTPVMLVVDEADAIAPQKPQANEARMLGAIEDIVRRGGQRGVGCALITQRSAVLNKNVLTQAQMLIVLRTIAPQDLAAMRAWIEVHGTIEEGKAMMEALPSLPIGDAYFWSPGWPTSAGIFQRTHILPIKTFDSGATPEPGEKKIVPRNLADVDLNALKKQMAATIEKAKNDNPVALKKRIKDLETQLAQGVKKTVPDLPMGVSQWMEYGKKYGYADFFKNKVRDAMQVEFAKEAKVLTDKLNKIAAITGAPVKWPETTAKITSPGEVKPLKSFIGGSGASGPGSEGASGSVTIKHPIFQDPDQLLDGPEQKILDAMAWCASIGIDKPQQEIIAFLAGYSNIRSTGYTNPRGRLKQRGLVEYGTGTIYLTAAGTSKAHAPDEPLTQDELHRIVLERLDGPERKLLTPLLEAHPEGIANEELATLGGYSNERSTGYTNPRGRLKSFGLIEYAEGKVIARDILFLP